MKTSVPRITLFRTVLVIAILAGLSSTGVNLLHLRQKIVTLQVSLRSQTVARQAADAGWAQTRSELARTAVSLAETKGALNAANVENNNLTAALATEKEGAERLKKQLAQTREEREEARVELTRFQRGGLTPEQIMTIARDMAKLREELIAEQNKNKVLTAQVAALTPDLPSDQAVPLPAGLRTKVSVTDPKWQFVVLDAGQDQGVLKHGELLISRNGKLVGKVRVSRVEKDRCVANIVTGWEFGDVMEGDVALPALPSS